VAAVELIGVSKVYPDGFEAVRRLSLSIADDEFHVLLGPSGCGKSTVLRMIAGLEDVSDGEIRVGGHRINDVPPRDRDMAMAFQTHALYPHMNVAENLGFPLRLIGLHIDEIAQRVRETARLLHLDDVLDRHPRELSGGQQQRVALGRSIIRRPQVFLMDEPLSNLDSRLRIEARSEIIRIQRRLHATTIFVTHDQVEAMAMAERVTVMRAGQIVQSATPSELYADPVDLFVAQFVGSPAMNVVLGAVVRPSGGDDLAVAVASQHIPFDRVAPVASPDALADGMNLAVGIRPEALHRDDDGHLTVSAEFTESLGSSRLVHASITAPSVSATPNGVRIGRSHRSMITAYVAAHEPVGRFAPFRLRIDPASIHLFDLDTGRTIAAPGRTSGQPFARPV